MKSYIIAISLLAIGTLGFGQREPQTSQYLIHPVLANPAAVAIRSGNSGALLFQKQWAGYQDSPTSFYANFNSPLKNQKGFLGGTVVSDQVGIHSRTKVFAIYAHKFRLNQGSYFTLGISPGADLYQSDYSNAQTDFANDPIVVQANFNKTSFNSGFGAHYYNNRFWAGVSIPALFYNYIEGTNGGKTSLSFGEMTYQFVAGWKKDLGKLITLKPSTMLRISPGAPLQFDINAMFEYREQIGLGISYRSSSTLNFMANYRLTNDFKLGYAFAMQMGSELSTYHSGTHELGLFYGVGNNRKANVNLPKKIKKYRKKKAKEIKKALKEVNKEKEKEEKKKSKKEDKEEPIDDAADQPYG
ncbi:MAG: PorP/SprF family type IX secretion system membrane protein [Salibacteraceae bacterium]